MPDKIKNRCCHQVYSGEARTHLTYRQSYFFRCHHSFSQYWRNFFLSGGGGFCPGHYV